eukprot:scaffold2863_cov288-Prasinococcus_capsulatus_cf.AAC.3
MLLWNSFVQENRIYADSYVKLACQRFAQVSVHRPAAPRGAPLRRAATRNGGWARQVNKAWIAKTAVRRRCFLLHLMNLADFGLVDADTISGCLRLVRGTRPHVRRPRPRRCHRRRGACCRDPRALSPDGAPAAAGGCPSGGRDDDDDDDYGGGRSGGGARGQARRLETLIGGGSCRCARR